MGKNKGDVIVEELNAIEIPELVKKKLTKFANIPNQKIVLSLAGGGAKGCVGNVVLLYLFERLNLMDHFEEIWGVSAGSMIGSAYCAGMSSAELINLISDIKLRDFIKFTNPKKLWENRGYFTTRKFRQFYQDNLPVKTFEECRNNFHIIATRIEEGNESAEVFDTGNLADAVTASMSIPDVFEPFILDGKMYFDGGMVENTPNISVFHHHDKLNDPRHLAIFSTCYGLEHYRRDTGGVLVKKLLNLLGMYRYRLQIAQNEVTRMQPNTGQLMINLAINSISKTDFQKMAKPIVPTFHQLLDKLAYICELDNWNITY
jgi:predicted acylesterase/phospholipase RssA